MTQGCSRRRSRRTSRAAQLVRGEFRRCASWRCAGRVGRSANSSPTRCAAKSVRQRDRAVRSAQAHDAGPRVAADGRDVLIGAIAVIDDITEQQRIDAIRRDFVANISHELKTPIGALVVLADALIDEERPGRHPAAGRAHARRRLSGESHRRRSARAQSYRRRRLGRPRAHLRRRRRRERGRPGASRGRQASRSRSTSRRSTHSVALIGDRRQLTSALFNLLDNAIKYSEPGSAVQVRVANTNDEVSLVVQDHGIGHPRQGPRPHLRAVLSRRPGAVSRETGGTGLGLSIVRHVVRNHGGEVTVISREGEGSTFMLILPTHLAAESRCRIGALTSPRPKRDDCNGERSPCVGRRRRTVVFRGAHDRSRTGGFPCHDRRRRRIGARTLRRVDARPRAARSDVAVRVGSRRLPRDTAQVAGADHHGDGEDQ